MKVLVIGGEIIGAFTSYYLRKSGHSVTIIDNSPAGGLTSVNSAGLVVPSLSSEPPIGIGEIFSSCFSHAGPMYISPREIVKHSSWMLRARVRQSIDSQNALMKLGEKSLQLYTEFFREESIDVDLIEGIASLYRNAEQAREEAHLPNTRFMDTDGISELGFKGFGGGVLHERELSVNPMKLLRNMERKLQDAGVNRIHATATTLQGTPPMFTSVVADGRVLKADACVIAGGSWSGDLCRRVGFNLQVLPARGITILFDSNGVEIAQIPAFFEDYGIVVVQHNQDTVRLTGFFDLVGFSHAGVESRKRWLYDLVREHVTKFDKMKFVEESVGYRPCTPDRLPSIGRVPRYSNLYIASGHCRIGITLAPATGYALNCMINGENCSIDLKHFTPSRPI